MSNSVLLGYVENEMVFDFKPVGGQVGGSDAMTSTKNPIHSYANIEVRGEGEGEVEEYRRPVEAGEQAEQENSVMNTVKSSVQDGISSIQDGVSRAGNEMFKNLETLGDQASRFQQALSMANKRNSEPNDEEIFRQICRQYSVKKGKEKIDQLFEEGFREFMDRDENANFSEQDVRAEFKTIKREFVGECRKIGS